MGCHSQVLHFRGEAPLAAPPTNHRTLADFYGVCVDGFLVSARGRQWMCICVCICALFVRVCMCIFCIFDCACLWATRSANNRPSTLDPRARAQPAIPTACVVNRSPQKTTASLWSRQHSITRQLKCPCKWRPSSGTWRVEHVVDVT